MSAIEGISSVSALWGSSSATSATSSVADQLTEAVSQMSGGGSGSGSDSDEETVTTTRTLSDGSIMITVTQGDEIISQTKIAGHNNGQNPMDQQDMMNNPAMQAYAGQQLTAPVSQVQQAVDSFNNTSSSIVTGSLFSAGI